jgi:hypothetical protein
MAAFSTKWKFWETVRLSLFLKQLHNSNFMWLRVTSDLREWHFRLNNIFQFYETDLMEPVPLCMTRLREISLINSKLGNYPSSEKLQGVSIRFTAILNNNATNCMLKFIPPTLDVTLRSACNP